MFDRDEPEHLMDSLCKFLPIFHGKKPDGVSSTKLEQSQLPYALRRVYECVNNWVGDGYLGNPFSKQDGLLPFEMLTSREGKTVFVVENQCVWVCGVDNELESDVVYSEGNGWRKEPFSLSSFLVTFLISESMIGARYHLSWPSNFDIDSKLESIEVRSTPLWSGRLVSADGTGYQATYQSVAELKVLRCGNGIATNDKRIFDQLKPLVPVVPEQPKQPMAEKTKAFFASDWWTRNRLEQQKHQLDYAANQCQKIADEKNAEANLLRTQSAAVQKQIDDLEGTPFPE
jgi:hypothetical protein